MESKCCSVCAQKRVLSCFLKNPSANPGTKVFSTCIPCRDKAKKRRALQPLDANRPSKRPDVSRPLFEAPTNPSILLPRAQSLHQSHRPSLDLLNLSNVQFSPNLSYQPSRRPQASFLPNNGGTYSGSMRLWRR
ncbi:hypothetical protein L207DRAFT_570230 [Hyaloscypha variabilis F]|uniref:Uncharacterized protein n=1 Tax=Hyaloscypha variabilis (strain UAMH 11265 / GT02V1 / F) TaxID=1149755 RepID=A0A2J6QR89_HYAVF|nr:hypothetical protein L207DRAFT_287664 [Hyaloscypha variabilis F]PMD35752.1 hypothetical protein L207DRAFT_570230 [Hyaloscypha variabilis F]